LNPYTLHSLRFQVRGNEWPENAQRLRIELLSTCPPGSFLSPVFEAGGQRAGAEFETAVTGNIQINAAQSDKAPDLAVSVRAAFNMQDGSVLEAPVVGHQQLRFRVASSAGTSDSARASRLPVPRSQLAPGQFDALQRALLAAFKREGLERMLRLKMNVHLDHIARNGSLTDLVYDVIDWADREGRVGELVRVAVASVPGNPCLQEFATGFERMRPCE